MTSVVPVPAPLLAADKETDALAGQARGMWTVFEPVHAVTYFTEPGRAALEAAGLRGFWRGYFAGRSAPLGPVAAPPVTALFHSFSPTFTERALPAVWDLITPDQALRARAAGAAAALREAEPDAGRVEAAVEILWRVLAGAESHGRALGAANLAVPRPDDPYEALWQACATLRELRGDGHVAALVSAGLSGRDVLVLRSGIDLDPAVMQFGRGWTDDEWAAATEAAHARGLIDDESRATPAGVALLAGVEAVTDRLAAQPWAAAGGSEVLLEAATVLAPTARACHALFPAQINPIGLQPVWDVSARPEGLRTQA